MSQEITLYDIPSKSDKTGPWSPNTLKTRFTLKYKGLPFKTVWVEYPDIANVCKKIGAAPTSTYADGSPAYTLPVIHDPSTDKVVSDSYAIAEYLDVAYPSTPVLIPSGTEGLHAVFQTAYLDTVFSRTYPLFLPVVPSMLNPSSEEYFIRTRTAGLGQPLAGFCQGAEREEQWKKAEGAWKILAGWYDKGGEGKLYLMGDTPSYADITVLGYLVGIRQIFGADSKDWETIASWYGGKWTKLIKAFEK